LQKTKKEREGRKMRKKNKNGKVDSWDRKKKRDPSMGFVGGRVGGEGGLRGGGWGRGKKKSSQREA